MPLSSEKCELISTNSDSILIFMHDLKGTYLKTVHIPPSLQHESELLLQLLFEQILKYLIASETHDSSTAAVAACSNINYENRMQGTWLDMWSRI